ncbi:MAG: hypothetical protein KDC53_04690 [Saprospiraceae bacterium]|nr:hypothetical protein [Saprospiraceae bacterium]
MSLKKAIGRLIVNALKYDLFTTLVKILRPVLILLVAFQPLFSQPASFTSGRPGTHLFVDTDEADTSFLQKLERGFNEAEVDTLKLYLVNDLGYYWHIRNLDSAFVWTHTGLDIARKTGNQLWEGRLLITLGAILLRNEQLDSAEIVLNQAKSKVSPRDLPFLHTQLGYVKERRGLLAEAGDQVAISLDLATEFNDQKGMALAHSDLSNLFWKQGKMREALTHGLRSLSIFQQRGILDLDYSFTFYVVGNIYLAEKKFDQALLYFDRSNEISLKYGFYNNLSDTYISLTDLFMETKEYAQATSASKEAIKYASILHNNFLLMRSWLSVGKLQNLENNCQDAIQSLNTCLRVATDNFGDDFYLQLVYFELAKAHASCNNYTQAFAAFQNYDNHRNRFFTAEADRRISELQTEFDVAQKEATITDQETKLKQQRKLQFASWGFVILLITVLIIIYYNYHHNKTRNQELAYLNKDLEEKNRELDQRNTDKEILLKEIHHRVKNNLEIVVSLLELQLSKIDNPEIQNVMLASQNRVQSIGIVHQKLYQSNNLGSIDMKEYLLHLIASISDSFNVQDHLQFVCEMEELEIDIDTAIPIGLITNELLTNAIKHAFPDNRQGIIQIGLEVQESGFLKLLYHDNGIGKNNSVASSGTGFGTNLIQLLTRQLEGTITENISNGTTITFLFKKVNILHGKAD